MATHQAVLRSSGLLAEFMKTKNIDTVILARMASIERMRHGGAKVSSQFIGQLRNGRVVKCSPDLANAIETVLEAPSGLLFDVRPKSSDRQQSDKGQAA